MRESLQRRRGPWQFTFARPQRSTEKGGAEPAASAPLRQVLELIRYSLTLVAAVLLNTAAALAQQSPWERAASNLELTFTGPLARSLALVAIVIGGLMFMFGEGGAKRQISGIVFGGGLALFAAQFLAWLF